MIIRSATAVSVPIEFPSGPPDGNSITVRVLNESGTILMSGPVSVPVDAVSFNITIDAVTNALGIGVIYGYRDLEWTYTVGGVIINGEQRYQLEARVPYGVSVDGVRAKLGVESHEVRDEEISLIKAYLAFETVVTPVLLATATDTIAIKDAIEATAALSLIPSMPVRVALKEASGTDVYQRDKIDWVGLGASLQAYITAGIAAVNPAFDPLAGFGSLLILATPATDAFTGAAPTG